MPLPPSTDECGGFGMLKYAPLVVQGASGENESPEPSQADYREMRLPP